MGWTNADLSSQSGKTFVITGANSGIGYEAAKQLCAQGARVLMLCRNQTKAEAAIAALRSDVPSAQVEFIACDLADLKSVSAAADAVTAACPDGIDALINNAGVMALPRWETKDGFEMQLGTNHLGHFALTGKLIDGVEQRNGRVVNVSSMAHKMGKMNFDDLMGKKRYTKWGAYGQSKLANLLFTFELNRRLVAAGKQARALASHPGYSRTNLQYADKSMPMKAMMKVMGGIAQSAEKGAWPAMQAACDPNAQGGDYYGPQKRMEFVGPSGPAKVKSHARDQAHAKRLWEISEQLTGVNFGI